MCLCLITVNVGVPSIDGAQRQLRWLANRPEQVLVLTAATALLTSDPVTAATHAEPEPEPTPF